MVTISRYVEINTAAWQICSDASYNALLASSASRLKEILSQRCCLCVLLPLIDSFFLWICPVPFKHREALSVHDICRAEFHSLTIHVTVYSSVCFVQPPGSFSWTSSWWCFGRDSGEFLTDFFFLICTSLVSSMSLIFPCLYGHSLLQPFDQPCLFLNVLQFYCSLFELGRPQQHRTQQMLNYDSFIQCLNDVYFYHYYYCRTDISVDLSTIAPRSHPRMIKVGSEPICGCVKLGLFHEDFEK